MKKLKSNLQNMVLVLVSVAVICGGTLAYFNQLTKPAIDEQAEKALADCRKAVEIASQHNKSDLKRLEEFAGFLQNLIKTAEKR
jgi:Na+-translocating ferredoxin:NAD+ oxidoreductase RnfG subunit